MSKFTVRVELRNSQDADYDELHDQMEANGFSRKITTDTGNTYELPNAEYIYESETKSKSDAGLLAESIAERIRKNPKILVTRSDGRWVTNLDKV